MEVHLRPDVQARLDQMARESGRPSGELIEDAVIGYFDELAYTRETLDRRFDELESGRAIPFVSQGNKKPAPLRRRASLP